MIMEFVQAKFTPLLFGPNRGKTIDEVAMTAQGLLHLDWMRQAMLIEKHREARHHRRIPLHRAEMLEALTTFLDDSTIAKDLAAVNNGDGDW